MTKTETDLIRACVEIGMIAEANCHYTAGLAARIEASGSRLENLTVAQLLNIVREHTSRFNERMSA